MAFISLVLFLIDDGQPGWDQLPEKLNIMVIGDVIVVLFLIVSFESGMFVWKQRRSALLWLLPSGIVLLVIIACGASLLVIYIGTLIGWKASWLRKNRNLSNVTKEMEIN
jgi:hypothetical protein